MDESRGLVDLPLELLEKIGEYLSKKDAKNLAVCSNQLYGGMQNRIWREPTFYFFRQRKEFVKNAWRFPVKILDGADLHGAVALGKKRLDFLNSLNLEEYRTSYGDVRVGDLVQYVDSSFKVIINTSILVHSGRIFLHDVVNICKGKNFEFNITHEGMDGRTKWGIEELLVFEGLNMKNFDVSCVRVGGSREEGKIALFEIMRLLNPECVHFDGDRRRDHTFLLNRSDIETLKDFNIRTLGSWYLRWDMEQFLPWKEFLYLKTLKKLKFIINDFISVKNLIWFTNIYAVEVGQFRYYGAVINLIEKLIEKGCVRYVDVLLGEKYEKRDIIKIFYDVTFILR